MCSPALRPSYRTVALAAWLFALGPTAGAAATLHVPADFARVSDALAAAGPGDSVLVAPGTYAASRNGETFPLLLPPGVTLLGAGMNLTVLDAEDQAMVVDIANGAGARLSGFTLTHGRALRGGGVRVLAGNPEIDRNLLLANRAMTAGSGIFLTGGAAAWVHHNVLWGNLDVDPNAPGDPHGIQLTDAHGLIEHNLIGRGDSNGLITQNTASPVIRNNIFYANGTPGVRGRGICHFGAPTTVIAHNLFHANAIAALLVQTPTGARDLTPAEANDLDPADGIFGNLAGNPLFANESQGDWHLTAGSPAIDAGDPASPLDPDGTPADIGPFHFHQGPASDVPPGDAPAARLDLEVSPSPFAEQTSITYRLAAAEHATLTIHDVMGRLVVTLVDRAESPGRHAVVWDTRTARGTRSSPGVYFARLAAGGGVSSQKIVLAD